MARRVTSSMSILQQIRLGAAIVLLCAIFLPLSQCSQHGDDSAPTPQALSHARHFFPRSDTDYQYQYGVKGLGLSLRGVLTLIAFVWPLGFAIWNRRFGQPPRFWWIFYGGELLLCAGTIYVVGALTLGGRWLYGAYVGEVAISIYACTSLILIFDRIRNRFRIRSARSAA
jgi:hypothetical protein